MKKNIYVAFLLAVFFLLVSSCAKEDDAEDGKSYIKFTWDTEPTIVFIGSSESNSDDKNEDNKQLASWGGTCTRDIDTDNDGDDDYTVYYFDNSSGCEKAIIKNNKEINPGNYIWGSTDENWEKIDKTDGKIYWKTTIETSKPPVFFMGKKNSFAKNLLDPTGDGNIKMTRVNDGGDATYDVYYYWGQIANNKIDQIKDKTFEMTAGNYMAGQATDTKWNDSSTDGSNTGMEANFVLFTASAPASNRYRVYTIVADNINNTLVIPEDKADSGETNSNFKDYTNTISANNPPEQDGDDKVNGDDKYYTFDVSNGTSSDSSSDS